ncbi:MAG: hypothetical protein FWG73_08640 [Planctomycetaceae bacterium]|nr:hypothetical protein [Planctomycetaceae bacterium]
MKTQQLNPTLPPDLSALEASLATLEPRMPPGSREAVKANALMRLAESSPPLTGEKLIETIVKTGDQKITLSLREYVKSARLVAGLYGTALGLLVGLLLGIGLMLLVVKSTVREVHHVSVPYFVNDVMREP